MNMCILKKFSLYNWNFHNFLKSHNLKIVVILYIYNAYFKVIYLN